MLWLQWSLQHIFILRIITDISIVISFCFFQTLTASDEKPSLKEKQLSQSQQEEVMGSMSRWRQIVVILLFVMFGWSSWIDVNGLWVELPLIVYK